MNRTACVLAVLLIVSPFAAAPAAQVINGSMTGESGFGSLPAPWQMLPFPGVYSMPSTVPPGGLPDGSFQLAPNIPASPDGGTFLAFFKSMILETDYAGQDISGLVPGTNYTLSFYYTNVGATFPPGLPITLQPGAMISTIAGQTFSTEVMAFEGSGLQTWRQATFTFQATQPVEHLGFYASTDTFWGGIDGVLLVPEPASSALLASGALVCAVCIGRRRMIRRRCD